MTRLIADRYEVLEPIGRGGMAEVSMARQLRPERLVVLKQLLPVLAASPDVSHRFRLEAEIAGRLNHPNIVTVFEYLEDNGIPMIAMEYLQHGTLRPWVGRLSLAQIGRVLDAVLAALDHAARHGVVHRDLKPENLLITDSGSIKVTDFGIAKALQAVSTGQSTAPGTAIGTAEYMSPEQVRGVGVDARADLYAVGVVAFELLTGRVPFPMPLGGSWISVAHQHAHEPPPAPRSLDPAIDPRLERWVLELLAKEPADRPATARIAADRLEEILAEILGSRWGQGGRIAVGTAPPRAAPKTAVAPAGQVPVGSLAAPPPPAPPSVPDGASAPTRSLPPRPGMGRGAKRALMGGAAAILAAGVVTGVTLLAGGDPTPVATTQGPATSAAGATGVTTLATAPNPPATTLTPPAPPLTRREAIRATDDASRTFNNTGGDPIRALEIQLAAIPALRGSGLRYEANANFNAGRAYLALAACDQALAYVERSLSIDGTAQQVFIRKLALGEARSCLDLPSRDPYGGQFQTPSKRISCTANAGRLRCGLVDGNVTPLFELSPSGAAIVRNDAVPNPEAPTLNYRSFWSNGVFRCRSDLAGLACRSLTSGQGFFLSREQQEALPPPPP